MDMLGSINWPYLNRVAFNGSIPFASIDVSAFDAAELSDLNDMTLQVNALLIPAPAVPNPVLYGVIERPPTVCVPDADSTTKLPAQLPLEVVCERRVTFIERSK